MSSSLCNGGLMHFAISLDQRHPAQSEQADVSRNFQPSLNFMLDKGQFNLMDKPIV